MYTNAPLGASCHWGWDSRVLRLVRLVRFPNPLPKVRGGDPRSKFARQQTISFRNAIVLFSDGSLANVFMFGIKNVVRIKEFIGNKYINSELLPIFVAHFLMVRVP